MGEFLQPSDIASRGLQHIGQRKLDPVLGFNEGSKAARETSFAYGKLRRAALRENVWSFATRKAVLRPIDTNTLLLAPVLWVSTTTYFPGQIVADAVGTLWRSQIGSNTGNPVATSQGIWEPYFGPMTVSLYDSSQAYNAGELVYTAAGDGTANVYESVTAANAVHPALPNQWSTLTTYFKGQVVQTWPAWSSGTTYSQGQGVLYTDGNVYVSVANGNVGLTPPTHSAWQLIPVLTLQSQGVPITTATLITPPATSPVLEWSQGTTYAVGNAVMFNGVEYVSLTNSNTGNFPNAAGSLSWALISNFTLWMSTVDLNIGNNPATDSGVHWTSTFTQGGGNDQWIQIGGASFPNGVGLTDLNITYPIGSGPVSQTWTKNAYRLPAGYLRRAAQTPKEGAFSWLGAPSNPMQDDWVYQGNYFTTWRSDPITFRFVADVTDVTTFDDMFCEGLAARIGKEVCEPLTQSTAKVQVCEAQYKDVMGRAKIANAIEQGSEQPPLDDLIACRF